MDVVSDEILFRVFSYLKTLDLIRCSRVNRQWHELTKVSALWRTIDLSSYCIQLRCLANLLLAHFEVTKTLILKQSVITDPLYCRHNFETSELQVIDLSGAYISFHGIKRLLRYSFQLKVLNIRGCIISKGHIAEISPSERPKQQAERPGITNPPYSVLKIIFNTSNVLREVDLGDIGTMKSLRYALRKPSAVQRLSFHCVVVTEWGLESILSYFADLTYLDITVSSRCNNYLANNLERIKESVRRDNPGITINITVVAECNN